MPPIHIKHPWQKIGLRGAQGVCWGWKSQTSGAIGAKAAKNASSYAARPKDTIPSVLSAHPPSEGVHDEFLGLHDPGVARVSDEGGEVSGSPEKPASTSTDTQVRVLHMGPASWQPGALLSCVGPEALLSCVWAAFSSVEIQEFFWGPPPKFLRSRSYPRGVPRHF